MKVFVSWSGERSQAVANYLRDWIACVIQAAKPWVSTRDIDRGSLWFGEISGEAAIGVICLTQHNKNQPWILFEAGALAKGLSSSRVCTLLIDLEPSDVRDPLAQFNHTQPNMEGMRALVGTLNGALGASGLDAKTLEQAFMTYWPQFEREFARILEATPAPVPDAPRSDTDVLEEILDTVRSTSVRVGRLEKERSRPLTHPLTMPAYYGGGEGVATYADGALSRAFGGAPLNDEQRAMVAKILMRKASNPEDPEGPAIA